MGGSSLYQGGAGKGSPAEFWVKTPFIFFDNFRAPSLFLFRTIFCIVWHFLAYFFHTSYLSPMPPLYLCRWKICRVEKFQISMQDKCGDFWNFSTWRVSSNLSAWQMWGNLNFLHIWRVSDAENVSTYVQFLLFCRKICFVEIYALLCSEKLNQKLPRWRKNWQILGMIVSTFEMGVSGKFLPLSPLLTF